MLKVAPEAGPVKKLKQTQNTVTVNNIYKIYKSFSEL